MIILDTGCLLAALDTSEPDHEQCVEAILTADDTLVMSPLILAEVDYMVNRRLGTDAEFSLMEDVREGRYLLAEFGGDDFAVALGVAKKYRDLNIGMADASNVALAARFATTRILTLDDHYRAVRPIVGGDSFTLLPADH